MSHPTGLGVAAALAFALLGAETAAPAAEPYQEEASVLAVELPVRVLVRGQAVADLRPEDFEVYDRGRRVEITGFEVLARGPARRRAEAVAAPLAANYLLLFDFAYGSGRGLARALEASRRLLAQDLEPGDRLGVGFFSALRGLRLISPPSADRERARWGLDTIEALLARDVRGATRLAERLGEAPDRLAELQVSPSELVAEAGVLVRTDPYWPHQSVIRSLARGLAALPVELEGLAGTRNLVLFSQGFDPVYLTGRGSSATLGELERSFKACRRAGWTVQSINSGGLLALGGRDTLFFLAHETGGESYENFNDVGTALDHMLHRTSVTYLLSFQVADLEADGSFHRLKVRLAKPLAGARILHRPGYYAPEPPAAP